MSKCKSFLLQTDEGVSSIESRAVRAASMLDNARLFYATLKSLECNGCGIDLPADACPVGSVEFVESFMAARGISCPEHMTYPLVLQKYLQRPVWEGTFNDLKDVPSKSVFIKPRYGIKAFTGFVFDHEVNEFETLVIPSDYPIYLSGVVEFLSEFRYYVLNNKIVGVGRYDANDDDNAPIPDINVVLQAIKDMSASGDSPIGYALDFGVISNGQTALVEANDGWALGYYRGSCKYLDYANLLHARWNQLLLKGF